MKFSYKFIFLFIAFVNLIFGMFSGLGRLGWGVPLPELYVNHGAIMVGGFLGSLIALEKIIPLRKAHFFVGPILSALSLVAFTLGETQFAVMMIIVASINLILVYLMYLKQHKSFYLMLAAIGAICWLIGNLLLQWKRFYPQVFPWWMGFLLFTIVSERLELSKYLPVTQKSKNGLIVFLGLFLLGIILPFHGIGIYLTGLSLIFISVWLMQHDVFRLTIKKERLARFTGFALLGGYVSLLLEGILLIVLRDNALGYDIIVHVFFLGFVFSMIFSHGPIILPGVLGLTVRPYHPLLYFPLVALYASLFLRIAADVMLVPFELRAISGWVTLAAILLYFILLVTSTVRAIRNGKTN